MTQYLLSVYMGDADETMSEDEIQRVYKAVDDFNNKVRSAGAWVFAGGLEPVESATTVDGTKSEPVVSPTARTRSPRSTSVASGSSRHPTSTPL
jgi:hypothetical protein